MAKDKRHFCLIEIGFTAKKKNELHLFYSIYSVFYLIHKICFKKTWVGGGCTDIFFNFFYVYFFKFYYNNNYYYYLIQWLLLLLFYYYHYHLLLLCYFYVYFILSFVFTLLSITSCVVATLLYTQFSVILLCFFAVNIPFFKIEKSNKYY